MGFFKSIINFFSEMKDSVLQGSMIAIFAVSILLIVGFLVFFIKRALKENCEKCILPITLMTLFTCIFMIPASLSITTLVKMNVRNEIKNLTENELNALQLEVKNKQLERDKLEKENKIMNQELEMNSLKKQVNLLKASQVSAIQFQKIAEIALIKTNIQQTKVWHKQISDTQQGWGLKADWYADGVLVVNTYDIDAKFGIDFNKICIKKLSDNKIQVAGIKPTYIGASKNTKESEVKEIRRYDYDKNGILKNITVKMDTASLNLADSYAEQFENEYQSSIANMDNWTYLTDAIVSLGQNFVKLIFAPVYSEIEFIDTGDEGFLPMKNYIEIEIESNTKKSEELSNVLDEVIKAELERKE